MTVLNNQRSNSTAFVHNFQFVDYYQEDRPPQETHTLFLHHTFEIDIYFESSEPSRSLLLPNHHMHMFVRDQPRVDTEP